MIVDVAIFVVVAVLLLSTVLDAHQHKLRYEQSRERHYAEIDACPAAPAAAVIPFQERHAGRRR